MGDEQSSYFKVYGYHSVYRMIKNINILIFGNILKIVKNTLALVENFYHITFPPNFQRFPLGIDPFLSNRITKNFVLRVRLNI